MCVCEGWYVMHVSAGALVPEETREGRWIPWS